VTSNSGKPKAQFAKKEKAADLITQRSHRSIQFSLFFIQNCIFHKSEQQLHG